MRKKRATKRTFCPIQSSGHLVSRFINSLLKEGKKHKARSILYGAFDLIEQKGTVKPWMCSRRPCRMLHRFWKYVLAESEGQPIKCLQKFARAANRSCYPLAD